MLRPLERYVMTELTPCFNCLLDTSESGNSNTELFGSGKSRAIECIEVYSDYFSKKFGSTVVQIDYN